MHACMGVGPVRLALVATISGNRRESMQYSAHIVHKCTLIFATEFQMVTAADLPL